MMHADFNWQCQPLAEKLIFEIIEKAKTRNHEIAKLEEDLHRITSTRLFDWLDYVEAPYSEQLINELSDAGFVKQGEGIYPIYIHPGAQLPRVVAHSSKEYSVGLALHVDSIADYLMTHQLSHPIEGSLFGNFRKCHLSTVDRAALWVVERRGSLTMEPTHENADHLQLNLQVLEQWMTRPRGLADENFVMADTLQLVDQMIREVGQNRAAWTVLEGERRYWQSRNTAGQIQKSRQDKLGMGWANHDHHTFRSSRHHFRHLVHLFELLGFHCRERFYAGEQAGWGAQVMENPICGLVLFLDVDLAPDEIAQDFAHEPLRELDTLGTIGLWCALHGDSILKSGMHHLEAQFLFDELKEDLSSQGISMMKPFSSFPYLKQAFTVGEKWEIDPERINRLVEAKKIDSEQAEHFLKHGALGSHLENLQRREGYKGFNKDNVSVIIKATDPRMA